MRPRQWLGVALVFAFLPTMTPIWYAAVGGQEIAIPPGFAAIVHLLFLAGLILVAFPTREVLAAAADLDGAEADDPPSGGPEEE